MDAKDAQKRLREAYRLLTEETTNRQKFESIRALIKDLNPGLDALLENTSKTLSDVEKFQKGDIILLSAEHLPENTDEEKERKKKFLFLINSWRQLEGEVKRISLEFENIKSEEASSADKITSAGKIISTVKGPFGIITLVGLLIVGASLFFINNNNKATLSEEKTEVLPAQTTPDQTEKIQVIIFNGKKLPLKDLRVASGADCMSERTESVHYHALQDEAVMALDGSIVSDPGGCGFGKTDETEIVEVSLW